MNDETGTEMPEPIPDVPAGVDAAGPTSTFMTGARGAVRMLAYLALMLVFAVVVSRAMQFVMGLLGFTGG